MPWKERLFGRHYITASCQPESDLAKNILLGFLFSFLASTFLLFFGIDSLFKGNTPHALILLALATVAILNILLLRTSGNLQRALNVMVLAMGCLNIYLLLSGGVGNSGFFWHFVFPPLAFFTLGLARGLTASLVLLCVSLAVIFIPLFDAPMYLEPLSFKARFIASFTTVGMMSFLYEYARLKDKKKLLSLNTKLHSSARTDELTGLFNRRGIHEKLNDELQRASRSQESFAIILCDIDHFKNFNDTYGHECGDFILQSIAHTFLASLRKSDSVSRWGGEEFLLLLPITRRESLFATAERLRQTIASTSYRYKDLTLRVTLSFGAYAPEHLEDIESIIRKADKYLYKAKESGRNKVMGNV